jgi:hypothetical protein
MKKAVWTRSSLQMGMLLTCIMLIACEAYFVNYLHYESQHQFLDPDHYFLDVISQEDYQQLSNPENAMVVLSDGRTIRKSETWDRLAMPAYKAVDDGTQYVRVQVKGTAPFVHRYNSSMFPVLFLCLVAVLLGVRLPKRGPE